MPRIPQVTRTLTITCAEVMVLNTQTGKTATELFKLSRTYRNDREVLKAVQKLLKGPLKAVHVVATATEKTVYGMTETEFLKVARPIEKRI